MSFKIDFKISLPENVVKNKFEKIKKQIEDDVKKSIIALGSSGLKYAEEASQRKLSTKLSELYKKNLYLETQDNFVFIGLKEEARWIEKGREKGFMEDLLNGKSSKTSASGKKYATIPLQKDSGLQTKTAPAGQDLMQDLKTFLKSNNVRYSKDKGLELDSKGSPRIGRLHSFTIKDIRDKKDKNMQNLFKNIDNIGVHQSKNSRTGKVERNIIAFRTITEEHKDKGKWFHPGTAPANILDETFKWILTKIRQEVLPELRNKYKGK